MIKLLILILFTSTLSFSKEFDPYDYPVCYEKVHLDNWAKVLTEHPNVGTVQALHALQLGLCQKVALKIITAPQADAIVKHFMPIFKKELKLEESTAHKKELIQGFRYDH